MKKYFVVADIHGFYNELISALKQNNFSTENPEHVLIACGDLFDRGPDAVRLYDFLSSLGDRFIFVRGNHEDLLEHCCNEISSGYTPSYSHLHNKTIDTISQFSGIDEISIANFGFYSDKNKNNIIDIVNNSMKEILQFINEKSVDYYELGDKIFCHGWLPDHKTKNNALRLDKAWRESDWESARWKNGMEHWYYGGAMDPALAGRTIFCGHWHCSYGWAHLKGQGEEFPDKNSHEWVQQFNTFIDEKHDRKLIALDACTAYSGKINCYTFEE